MKKFFVRQLTENWFIEIEYFKSVWSFHWLPIFDHSLNIKAKGSHRGLYWNLYILGIKIFEINIYDNRHEESTKKPTLDF